MGLDSDLLPKIAKAECMSDEKWGAQRQCAGKITRLCGNLTWKVTLAIIKTQLLDPLLGPICPNLLSLELEIDGSELPNEETDINRWTPLLPLLIDPGLGQLTLVFHAVTERVVNVNIQSLIHIAPRIHTVLVINYVKTFPPDYSVFSYVKWLEIEGFINY
ncbi:hypothetical protein FRB93_007241 [Tulasnella sp. JGI-2019a]|nr:hypothetical protein FRB93_007241 [Tulasnella sp. JGI-2019a]